MARSTQKQINEIYQRGKQGKHAGLYRPPMVAEINIVAFDDDSDEGEENQTEVAKRGKDLNLLRKTMQASSLEKGELSSSYCSEERQSRTSPGNNRETSSESNCSRMRKGASYNSEEHLQENENLKEASKVLTQNVRGLGYEGNQNKVAKRGKHLSLLQAPSLNRIQVSSLEKRQSRSFAGNNCESSKATPSESNCSRKRKGASHNSETRKLKRTVSSNNQETNDQTGHQLNSVKQGKHVGLHRRPTGAEINIVAFDDDSDTTLNEKEILIQFLLDFKDWFLDGMYGIYQEFLHGEELDIIRMQDFLRERCCSKEDLSSYAFIMFEYLNLTKGEQKRFPKPRSDCACRFKNIILRNSTPAEFIANTFMFKNNNRSVIRHEISMKEMFQLYRFLALDKSLSQEYIVAQIREAAVELCNEYGYRYFLYSFLERKVGREKTLQGLIDVGIVQKEDLEKYNVYFGTLLLPFLQTHRCLKILIEWYPEHLRPSDIVRSLQPNEKDGSVLSIDDFKLVFTLAIKHFPQKLGFLQETDKSQNRPRSGMHILDHDFHTSPYEEIYKMQTKREEALDVMKACVNEAGLSLPVDTIENLHVDCRNKMTISKEKEMGIRDKRKCQRESSKMARNLFDKKMFESILDKSSELVSKQKAQGKTKMRMKSLRNFYTEHGHFKVSSKSNGPLFSWLYEVKKSYKLAMQGKVSSGWKLTRERYNELVAIGFPFQSIRLPPVPQTSLDGSHCKSKTSRNEKDVHMKIPSIAENNPQSISTVSILQDANNKRTKKAASALSSYSESQFKKRSKKVHTTSEAKCPLTKSGNSVPENNKQDIDRICHEPPKRIGKMRGSSEASVEKCKNLNEREYIRNTLASSNGAWEPIPYEADNTILLPQTQQFQQNSMNSTSFRRAHMTSNTRTQIPTQEHNSSQGYYNLQHQQYQQQYQQPFHPNQYRNMQQQQHFASDSSQDRYFQQQQQHHHQSIQLNNNDSIQLPYTCTQRIPRVHLNNDQEIAAALMKNEDIVNKLVAENSRLRENLVDMNTILMTNDEQINKLVTKASRLEDKLKATEKQHYETKRKLTDQLAEVEKKRESEKKNKKRLVLKYETLKHENEKMKKDATMKMKPKVADSLQAATTYDKDLMKENDKLKQKHKEYEQNLQELQCAICLGGLKNPHKPPKCDHRFCKTCIVNEIEKAVKYGRDKCCPTCRSPIGAKRQLRKDE